MKLKKERERNWRNSGRNKGIEKKTNCMKGRSEKKKFKKDKNRRNGERKK